MPDLFIWVSLSLSLMLACICGLKATNDVIMIYHVTQKVSLFLPKKKEINTGVLWSLQGPRRLLWTGQVRVRPGRGFGRLKKC